MIKDLVRATYTTVTEWYLCFDYDENSGYAFPCDENWNVLPFEYDCARQNYEYCLEHPEIFIARREGLTRRIREPAHGRCSCGREVYLTDDYMGACQCECGQWYNLFGQELIPPEYWED